MLRMYRILDTFPQASLAHYQAINAETGKAVELLQEAGSAAEREDHGLAMVCLTESIASWVGSAAFELRWTSLAA